MAPDQAPVPELVFVPARPQVSRGGRDVAYETRTLADGTVALPVYSTVTKLVAALGHYQPWICVPLRTVQADMGKAGVRQVVLDAAVDTSAWHWQEGGLRILADGRDLPGQRAAWVTAARSLHEARVTAASSHPGTAR
jgi:hypothetical protein